MAYIQITTRCNMSCEHCAYSCTHKGSDMSMKMFEKACMLAYDFGQPISIGGGEPTLHKHFWAFLGIALSYTEEPGSLWLATNGSQTETTIKLARMAKNGIIGCALSQDWYHDPIDQRAIDAFSGIDKSYYMTQSHDLREIRNVSHSISDVGRAKENGIGMSDNCVCSDIFITPRGRIYACGCKTVSLGTVDNPEIPNEFEWEDYGCPEEFKRNRLDNDDYESDVDEQYNEFDMLEV